MRSLEFGIRSEFGMLGRERLSIVPANGDSLGRS
jgi:hypothetical protein